MAVDVVVVGAGAAGLTGIVREPAIARILKSPLIERGNGKRLLGGAT